MTMHKKTFLLQNFKDMVFSQINDSTTVQLLIDVDLYDGINYLFSQGGTRILSLRNERFHMQQKHHERTATVS